MVDTAGQEKFRALIGSYYQGADCCLLVYDITSKESFLEIKDYYSQMLKEKCDENIKVILLGNKSDLENQRQVSTEEGIALSVENHYEFNETSCIKNLNVADSFQTLIEMTNREIQKKNEQKGIIQNQTNSRVEINNINVNANQNRGCPCWEIC